MDYQGHLVAGLPQHPPMFSEPSTGTLGVPLTPPTQTWEPTPLEQKAIQVARDYPPRLREGVVCSVLKQMCLSSPLTWPGRDATLHALTTNAWARISTDDFCRGVLLFLRKTQGGTVTHAPSAAVVLVRWAILTMAFDLSCDALVMSPVRKENPDAQPNSKG